MAKYPRINGKVSNNSLSSNQYPTKRAASFPKQPVYPYDEEQND